MPSSGCNTSGDSGDLEAEHDQTGSSVAGRVLPAGAPSANPAFDPAELLSRIWQQSLPMMRERFRCLERAALEAREGTLTVEARVHAADLAHKFAGALGMFGFPQGTEISRELEQLLDSPTPIDVGRFQELTERLRSATSL